MGGTAMSCRQTCSCQCNRTGCGCRDGEQFNIRVIEIRIPFEMELAVKILGGFVVLAGVAKAIALVVKRVKS